MSFIPTCSQLKNDPHLNMHSTSNFIRCGWFLGGSLSTSSLMWPYNCSKPILYFTCFPPNKHIASIFPISTSLPSTQSTFQHVSHLNRLSTQHVLCLNITFPCCGFLPNMPFRSACPSPQHVLHPHMFPAQHDPHLNMCSTSNFIICGWFFGGSLCTSSLMWP